MPQTAPVSSILVGIDGSSPSLAALKWACDLAARHGAKVTAISAWTYPPSTLPPLVGAPSPPGEVFADAARKILEHALGAANPSVEVETEVILGGAGAVLVENSDDFDLMVVGRTGRGRLARMIIGSTTRHVARHATCPVVIVNDATEVESRITVAGDGSKHSIDALNWAMRLDPEATIAAVYSHDEPTLDDVPLDDAVRDDFDERATDFVDDVIKQATPEGAPTTKVYGEVRTGDPRTTIVDATQAGTLLVLGARGLSGVAGVLVGSLADYAVGHGDSTIVIFHNED